MQCCGPCAAAEAIVKVSSQPSLCSTRPLPAFSGWVPPSSAAQGRLLPWSLPCYPTPPPLVHAASSPRDQHAGPRAHALWAPTATGAAHAVAAVTGEEALAEAADVVVVVIEYPLVAVLVADMGHAAGGAQVAVAHYLQRWRDQQQRQGSKVGDSSSTKSPTPPLFSGS